MMLLFQIVPHLLSVPSKCQHSQKLERWSVLIANMSQVCTSETHAHTYFIQYFNEYLKVFSFTMSEGLLKIYI